MTIKIANFIYGDKNTIFITLLVVHRQYTMISDGDKIFSARKVNFSLCLNEEQS